MGTWDYEVKTDGTTMLITGSLQQHFVDFICTSGLA